MSGERDRWAIFGPPQKRAVFVHGMLALLVIFVVLLAAMVHPVLALVLLPVAMVLLVTRTMRLGARLRAEATERARNPWA